MIVCHCNQLSSSDIRCAVKCMMTNCQNPDLCPENVYQELGACPNCCACFPIAEEMIHESAMQFIAKADLPDCSLAVEAIACQADSNVA